MFVRKVCAVLRLSQLDFDSEKISVLLSQPLSGWPKTCDELWNEMWRAHLRGKRSASLECRSTWNMMKHQKGVSFFLSTAWWNTLYGLFPWHQSKHGFHWMIAIRTCIYNECQKLNGNVSHLITVVVCSFQNSLGYPSSVTLWYKVIWLNDLS